MALSIPIFLNSGGAQGTPTNFTQNFGTPIYLNPVNQYLIYLKKFTYYNSIKNITAEQDNNKLKYRDSFDQWATFTFEDGAYNINDMNRTLYEYFETIDELYDVDGIDTSPIYFEAMNSTDKIKINLRPGWHVDFTEGKLCDRLGFYNDIITATQTGGKAANITDQDSIMIHCSITSDSIFNGNKSDVIENVPIKVPPNYQQVYEPLHITYSLINTSTIYGIQMRLTDQLGKEIKLDDDVTYDMSIIQSSRMV